LERSGTPADPAQGLSPFVGCPSVRQSAAASERFHPDPPRHPRDARDARDARDTVTEAVFRPEPSIGQPHRAAMWEQHDGNAPMRGVIHSERNGLNDISSSHRWRNRRGERCQSSCAQRVRDRPDRPYRPGWRDSRWRRDCCARHCGQPFPTATIDFTKHAVRYFPPLLAALTEIGTTDPLYRKTGKLMISLSDAEDRRLEAIMAMLVQRREDGMPNLGALTWKSAERARAMFPPLGPIQRTIHVADAARVDGDALRLALVQAARHHGASVSPATRHLP
jgi:hypothetical protein